MVYSMTGYGKGRLENELASVEVEVKTLNSKFLDPQIRMSSMFSDKEVMIKKILSDSLERGKVSVFINFTPKKIEAQKVNLNKTIAKHYYSELKEFAVEVGEETKDLINTVVQLPDVFLKETNEDEVSKLWLLVEEALREAVLKCKDFRQEEGAALEKSLLENINQISTSLEEVKALDPQRKEKVKEKLRSQLAELTATDQFDQNRFEQELIYYIEKYDISEEKVRLQQHLDYFNATISGAKSVGKKLGFIAQEIGREINTIGSKANDAGIQKLVVVMKDELEKIKEQSLNVV